MGREIVRKDAIAGSPASVMRVLRGKSVKLLGTLVVLSRKGFGS